MPESPSDLPPALEALAPVDGRYRNTTAPLRALLSEAALVRERIRVEALWLLHLSGTVAQLPGAQHSFDLFSSVRFEAVIDGIAAFTASMPVCPESTSRMGRAHRVFCATRSR